MNYNNFASNNDFQKKMEEFRKQQELERNGQVQQQKVSYHQFDKFYSYVEVNNDPKMWQWVAKQEDVIKADNEVKTLFIGWLLDTHRSQFSKFVEEAGYPQIQNYCDIATQKSKEYKTPEDEFKEEREQYNKRISDLESKLMTVLNKEEEILV